MRIGELARLSGVSARMLRHYDGTGLVRPTARTAAGYREYSAADVRRLFHVESLRSLGMSLREVARALDDPGFDPAELVDELVAAAQERIAREKELLGRLERIRSADPWGGVDVLSAVVLMRGLSSADPSRRLRAALSVGRGAGQGRVLAEAVLAESDENVAGTLRWRLARAGEGGVDVLGRALGAEEPGVRGRAVAALAAVDTDEAAVLLKRALRDPDPDTRGRAALALGRRGDARVVDDLIDMIVGGVRDTDAADVLGALAREHGVVGRIVGDFARRLEE